jgi:hypothetical protein
MLANTLFPVTSAVRAFTFPRILPIYTTWAKIAFLATFHVDFINIFFIITGIEKAAAFQYATALYNA